MTRKIPVPRRASNGVLKYGERILRRANALFELSGQQPKKVNRQSEFSDPIYFLYFHTIETWGSSDLSFEK